MESLASLYTNAKSNLRNKVLSEVEKDGSTTLPGKGRQTGLLSRKTMCSTLGGCDEGFYNNNSKLPSNGGAKASPCGGSTCCRAQALESSSSSSYGTWAQQLWLPGSRTQAQQNPALALLHVKQFEHRLVKNFQTHSIPAGSEYIKNKEQR